MSIAASVAKYLMQREVQYSLLEHEYSEGSFNTAQKARIDDRCLVKAVVLRDEDFHYILCALPAHNKILRHTLNQMFDRHLELVDEDELARLFPDCAPGAIPALGDAYGLDTVWDEELAERNQVFVEAGDHRQLIRLSGADFVALMADKLSGHFSAERQRFRFRKSHLGKKPPPESLAVMHQGAI